MNTHTRSINWRRLSTSFAIILMLGAGLAAYAGMKGSLSATANANILPVGNEAVIPDLTEEQIAAAIEREIYLPRLPEPVSAQEVSENNIRSMETPEGLKIMELIYPKNECNISANSGSSISIAMNRSGCL